jgi:hypothetical protein
MRHFSALSASLLLFLAACGEASGRRPVAVQHVVLLKLKDSARADAMVKDTGETLSRIPGIVSFHCGRPLDTARAEVTSDYDVGVVIAFDGVQSLKAYPDHPVHRALLDRWRPEVASIRIFDVGDGTK